MLDKFKYIKPIFDVRNELETQMLLLVDEQIQLNKDNGTERDKKLKELMNIQIKLKQIYIFKDAILSTLMNLSDTSSSDYLTYHVENMIHLEIESIKMSIKELDPKRKDYQMALDIHELDLEIMNFVKQQYTTTSTCVKCGQDFITDEQTYGLCINCLVGDE